MLIVNKIYQVLLFSWELIRKWKLARFCSHYDDDFLKRKIQEIWLPRLDLQQAFKNEGSVCVHLFYTYKVNNNNNKWKSQITEIHQKKKKVLIAMASEFKLPLEDCHENLGKNPSTKWKTVIQLNLLFKNGCHCLRNI